MSNVKSIPSLTRALQDYLKAIYIIQTIEGQKVVRVRDIANLLGVKMSSVTDALKKLHNIGLIEYSKRNYVDLTDEGRRIASQLYNRWRIIYEFLKNILMLDDATAKRDACKLEHVLSEKTYNAIKAYLTQNT